MPQQQGKCNSISRENPHIWDQPDKREQWLRWCAGRMNSYNSGSHLVTLAPTAIQELVSASLFPSLHIVPLFFSFSNCYLLAQRSFPFLFHSNRRFLLQTLSIPFFNSVHSLYPLAKLIKIQLQLQAAVTHYSVFFPQFKVMYAKLKVEEVTCTEHLYVICLFNVVRY